MRLLPCLLLLVAALCGPAAAHMSACQRKCAEKAYAPLCVSWVFDGTRHYEALPNKCWLNCYNHDNSSPASIVDTDLQLPAICRTEFEQLGLMTADACTHCPGLPDSETPGQQAADDDTESIEEAADAQPQLASRRALKSLSPCQRRCAGKAYAPLCARLPSTGLTMAFPNPCFLACSAQGSQEQWRVLARHIHLPAKCRRQWKAVGWMTGMCLDCPARLG